MMHMIRAGFRFPIICVRDWAPFSPADLLNIMPIMMIITRGMKVMGRMFTA